MALDPSRLQDFRLDAKIGVGSTARVFEAEHLPTGRKVAVKMLEPAASGSSEHRERLAREALLLAEVTSPHVGRILGYGYDKDNPFLVLERLVGETLDEFLKREKFPSLEQLIGWVEELLIGVRDIHAVGIVHRDIKPSNVFLAGPKLASAGGSEKITVKLIDFGVARLREMAHVTDALTTPSHVIGSLGYMAPEQFRRARGVTPAADLYAVGVVIYRALTGKLPFNDHSLERVVRMKTEEQAPRVSASGKIPLDSPLDLFIAKALQRDAGERFQSAREMLEAWWQATEAAGIEPPPPPATVEGMDIVFEDEPPIPSEVTEAMLETLSGPAPAMSVRGADLADSGINTVAGAGMTDEYDLQASTKRRVPEG
jgi:serine/threonine protein kinase